MKKENNYTHICYYINSAGNRKSKLFESEKEGLDFCKLLDERIKRGTCGGYSFSRI